MVLAVKVLGRGHGFVVGVRLDSGDELLGSLREAAVKAGVSSGFFFGIGGLRKAVLGYFVGDRYVSRSFDEQLEVVALVGNVSVLEGEVFIHAHLTLGRRDYSTVSGHALPGCIVHPTMEVVMVSTGVEGFELRRRRVGAFSPLD